MSGKRPSDDMQRQSKRRPGEQLTKDNFEDDDDEPAVDPGTWGKADAATMARRKVIKVRRGAGGAAADQQAPTAAAADNPFAGVALAPTSANPSAGIAMTASAADQGDAQKASEEQPPAAEAAASGAAEQADATPAAKEPEVAKQPDAASPAAAAGAAAAAAQEQPNAQEQQEAPKPDDKSADMPADTTGDQQAEKAQDTAADKAEDKPAAASTSSGFGSLAAGSTGGFGGIAGSTGGFGGFGSSTGGFAGFGAGGGFGSFAATAGKEGEGSGSLFGNFKAPPPGSSFGFGSAGGKPKDVEEGGEGEEGAEENGQELFGGPEVAPVVQLSEVPKQTGEEGENNVFAAEGKLYEYVDSKDWKERGRGELRLNVHSGTHKARLVMRQKGSQRLLLNANLYPQMPTSKMVGGKGATFAAVNAAPPVPAEGAGKEGEGADAAAGAVAASSTMKTYAFKAKSAAEIDDFLAKVDQYKATSVEPSAGEGDKQANPDGWGPQ